MVLTYFFILAKCTKFKLPSALDVTRLPTKKAKRFGNIRSFPYLCTRNIKSSYPRTKYEAK